MLLHNHNLPLKASTPKFVMPLILRVITKIASLWKNIFYPASTVDGLTADQIYSNSGKKTNGNDMHETMNTVTIKKV